TAAQPTAKPILLARSAPIMCFGPSIVRPRPSWPAARAVRAIRALTGFLAAVATSLRGALALPRDLPDVDPVLVRIMPRTWARPERRTASAQRVPMARCRRAAASLAVER